MRKTNALMAICVITAMASSGVQAATVSAGSGLLDMSPGQSRMLEITVASDTAIFGYTLQLQITPQAGALGSLTFDATTSDWGDPGSLIPSAKRDPTFTDKKLVGTDLFATTNTSDLSAIIPVAGTNDTLLRAALLSSADASGYWTVSFVSGVTVLSDGNFQSIPANWGTATVFVPEPISLAVLAVGGLMVGVRRLRRS